VTALPWFLRLVAASRLSRVEQIADALRPLLKQTFDAYMPLVQNAGVTDIIRQTGYVVAYATRAGFHNDALAWKLRRDRGVLMEELDSAGIKQKVPQLGGHYEAGLYLPEQGYVTNPERLTKSLHRAGHRSVARRPACTGDERRQHGGRDAGDLRWLALE
jgi:D-amino-acid dehydrogenase